MLSHASAADPLSRQENVRVAFGCLTNNAHCYSCPALRSFVTATVSKGPNDISTEPRFRSKPAPWHARSSLGMARRVVGIRNGRRLSIKTVTLPEIVGPVEAVVMLRQPGPATVGLPLAGWCCCHCPRALHHKAPSGFCLGCAHVSQKAWPQLPATSPLALPLWRITAPRPVLKLHAEPDMTAALTELVMRASAPGARAGAPMMGGATGSGAGALAVITG